MISVSILKQGEVTNKGEFSSMEEAQAWLAKHEGLKSFGQPAQTVRQQIELSPAVIAEDGSVLQEAVTEIQETVIPASYEVKIEDMSAKLEQERVNSEALAFLAATDYLIIREMDNGVPCPVEIKAQRQAARERILK